LSDGPADRLDEFFRLPDDELGSLSMASSMRRICFWMYSRRSCQTVSRTIVPFICLQSAEDGPSRFRRYLLIIDSFRRKLAGRQSAFEEL
jgi:hypothetical protein